MSRELTLPSENGGQLAIVSDSNRDYPDFIQWHTATNSMFGIVTNSTKARRFLRTALKRLEADARKRKPKGIHA